MQSLLNKKIKLVILSLLVFLASTTTSFAFGEGTKGPSVFAVQGMLKSLGYYSGHIDGIYGSQLISGVTYFQRTYGLQETGAVDAKTLQSILWAYGNLKIPAAPKTPKTPETPKPPEKLPEKQPGIPGLSVDEQLMVNLVNQERNKAGISPLSIDLELARVARFKSKEMIDQNYFSHQSPTYGTPFEMMKKFAINYKAAAENIACNQNVNDAHTALMESPGHRKNILDPKYTHVGIGIVKGGMCGEMYTQMFISK